MELGYGILMLLWHSTVPLEQAKARDLIIQGRKDKWLLGTASSTFMSGIKDVLNGFELSVLTYTMAHLVNLVVTG